MEEDIKILEEIVEIYYYCAGNKEKDYDMRVDMGFMKKETQALENLINRVKELEKEKANYNHAKEIIDKYYDLTNKIYKEFIPKSIIREKCKYCNEDYDGWYKPLDKNGHLCIFDNPHEQILDVSWYGHKMRIPINYCPMCGRKLGGTQ